MVAPEAYLKKKTLQTLDVRDIVSKFRNDEKLKSRIERTNNGSQRLTRKVPRHRRPRQRWKTAKE
jgi:hypothetical protein